MSRAVTDDVFRRGEGRRVLLLVIIALVLAGGALAGLGAVSSYGRLLAAFEHASPWWLPLCAAGEAVAYAGYILAYRDVGRADGGFELGYWQVARVVAVGFGASVIGSSVGSLAVDYGAFRQAGGKAHESARRVLALNTLDWAALGSATVIASMVVLIGRGSGVPLAMAVSWLIVVPACVAAALWVTSPRRVERLTLATPRGHPSSRRVDDWLGWLWGSARNGFADAVAGVVLVRHLLARPGEHRPALLGFPLFWVGDIGCAYAALRSSGAHIGAAPLVVAYASSYAVTLLPLPLGGAGGIEASLALTLHLVGVPLASAIVAVLVYRAFTFWLPIIPALLALPTLSSLQRELSAVRRVDTPSAP